jgi:electron transport complex protein RnfG
MKEIIKYCLVLGVITAVAGFFLGVVYSYTKERIELQEREIILKAVKDVLAGMDVEEVVQEGVTQKKTKYWVGKVNGEIKGYAFMVSKFGYSDDIRTIVGLNKEGEIMGIEITYQLETPGLGSRIVEVPSSDYIWEIFRKRKGEKEEIKPWFQEQFIGLTISKPIIVHKGAEWVSMSKKEREALKQLNDISAISGATITSKAVADSINDARRRILNVLNEGGAYTRFKVSETTVDEGK